MGNCGSKKQNKNDDHIDHNEHNEKNDQQVEQPVEGVQNQDEIALQDLQPTDSRDIQIEIPKETQRSADEIKMKLKDATYSKTPAFTIKDYKAWAKVIKFYDGDTCYLALFYNDQLVKIKCRVAELDTAELKSKDPREIEHAKRALDRFKELCGDDCLVWVHIKKADKYGRFLAVFYSNEDELDPFHETLINEGLAYRYDGRTKTEFSEWCPPEN